jgi:hypothetical protein
MRGNSLIVLVWSLAFGCAPGLSTPAPTGPSSPAGPGSGTTTPTVGGGTTPADAACSDQAKLVYLIDQSGELTSFKPSTLAFTSVGVVSCPAQQGSRPFSMAIDRSANAWVLYDSGELFKVSTRDASCTATSFAVGQQGMYNFGMGFASNTAGSSSETLFIAGGARATSFPLTGGEMLASIDLASLRVAPQGQIAGDAELSGTGDGNLWGFLPTVSPPRVMQIDKATGQQRYTYDLSTLGGSDGLAWAFAFWGGDFWIFLQRSTDPSTVVYRLKAADGSVTTVLPSSGRHIVGAGVSTCAPTTNTIQ